MFHLDYITVAREMISQVIWFPRGSLKYVAEDGGKGEFFIEKFIDPLEKIAKSKGIQNMA